jgi:OPA family glycerol-3-phosphate transporter-like MFS transporter
MGIIATAGFWTYALAVLMNGPIAERLGGRRAILFCTFGSAVMNAIIGACFAQRWPTGLIGTMSVLYAANMYFQSFGALSVVKVNSAWFHVRERGVLGGVFGSMISAGYALAYGVCGWLFHKWSSLAVVYLVPSVVIMTMCVVDFFVVRDKPSDAGHADFDTGDEEAAATSGENPRFFDVTRRVLAHPVLRRLALAEFCTGFVRQGLLLHFPAFLKKTHHIAVGSSLFSIASTGITVGGIAGALLCGVVSDYFFQSRRAPVAFVFYVGQVGSLLLLRANDSPVGASLLIGFTAMWIFGVHGMLSGTASMDFGGRKGAATAAGLLDGIQYVGAGLTGLPLGWVIKRWGWGVWAPSLIPFSIAGAALMLTLWNAKPQRAH